MVSVVSVTYFSTPVTIRTQEAVLSWNRDRTWISILWRSSWCKHVCSRLGQFSFSYESSLLLEISDRYEAAKIPCINVPFRWVLLHQVGWNIVLLRRFSNQRQSIVWITSGCQIVVRIVARILATNFPVAVHRYEGQPSTPNFHVLQVSTKPWYLWISPCTYLLLLRRHWADLQK